MDPRISPLSLFVLTLCAIIEAKTYHFQNTMRCPAFPYFAPRSVHKKFVVKHWENRIGSPITSLEIRDYSDCTKNGAKHTTLLENLSPEVRPVAPPEPGLWVEAWGFSPTKSAPAAEGFSPGNPGAVSCKL